MKKILLLSILIILASSIILAEENDVSGIPKITETVKCIFANSNVEQKCYASNSLNEVFSCKGIGSCSVEINGIIKENLLDEIVIWKSSCSGNPSTRIDGQDEIITFECKNNEAKIDESEIEQVSEQVKCLFSTEIRNICSSFIRGDANQDGEVDISDPIYISNYLQGSAELGCWDAADVNDDERIDEEDYLYLLKYLFEGGQRPLAPFPTAGNDESCDNNDNDNDGRVDEGCLNTGASSAIYRCYANTGARCEGAAHCTVTVSGKRGTGLIWKSSCGGEDKTIIDGKDEYAEFQCQNNKTQKEIEITEKVKCVFKNAKSEQKCYANSGESCTGSETCTTEVTGVKGERIVWKSSCGGYDYTVIDGEEEYAEFDCSSGKEVEEEQIKSKGFKFAYWQCYDGMEEKSEEETSCKTSDIWRQYAEEFCKNHCSEEGSKCGINTFSVSQYCYDEESKKGAESQTQSKCEYALKACKEGDIISCTKWKSYCGEKLEKGVMKEEEEIETILTCKDSCPLDNKCYPFGYRKEGKFCIDKGSFEQQRSADEVCENNFECKSNVCVSEKCVSQGLLEKILNWFREIFGAEKV